MTELGRSAGGTSDDEVVQGELVDDSELADDAADDDLVDEDDDSPPEGDALAALGLGGLDLGGLLAQAQQMQQQMVQAQTEIADETVEGNAGGGVVRITATGGFEFQAVHIDPKVVDPGDVEMLEDLVLAAIRDAITKVGDLNKQAMGGLGGLFGS